MSKKPGILCKVEKGKFVDTAVGFVDTFNWLVDFCSNLRGDGDFGGGGMVKVDTDESDVPTIRLEKVYYS